VSESSHPTKNEIEFLNLTFNRFLDLFSEIVPDRFWAEPPYHRFSKIKDLFAVYSEILKYPPIEWLIDANPCHNHYQIVQEAGED
jgi:hypothetical protein